MHTDNAKSTSKDVLPLGRTPRSTMFRVRECPKETFSAIGEDHDKSE